MHSQHNSELSVLASTSNIDLPVIEINGVRVITLSRIDKVHGRIDGNARKRFNDNRARFIEGEDYFVRNADEAREIGIVAPNGVTLLSESGYFMLVKSFTDDLAWDVQKSLVKSYFRAKEDRSPVLPDFNNPIIAARAWADQAEARLIAEKETKLLAAEVEDKTEQLQVAAPKIQFHDAVNASVNCYSVGEAAKTLGTGQNHLYRSLRESGVLMRNNAPYQTYLDRGYFKVRLTHRTDMFGDIHLDTKTFVTGKGLAWLQKYLSKTA